MARWRRKLRRRSERVDGDGDGDNVPEPFPELLPSLILAVDEFAVATVARGAAYAREGRVLQFDVAGRSVLGSVRGSRLYLVEWRLDASGWSCVCECRHGSSCEHGVAVVLAAAGYYYHHLSEALRRRVDVLNGANPHAVTRARAVHAPVAAVVEDRGARDRRALATLLGDPLISLRRAALEQLIEGGPVHRNLLYEVGDELAEGEPDLRAALVVRKIAQATGGWVPELLRPFHEREDLLHRVSERAQDAARQRILHALASDQPNDGRHFRVEMSVTASQNGAVLASLLPLVTSRRLDSVPRSLDQLRQAHADFRSRGKKTSVPQLLLLEWLVEGLSASGHFGIGAMRPSGWMLRSLNRFRDDGLVTWSAGVDAALAERGGITAGAPVVFSLETVRWDIDCRPAGDRNLLLGLAYRWPDGRTRRADECVILSAMTRSHGIPETFVLSDGVIHETACDLASDVVAAFSRVSEIEVGVDRHAALVGRLVSCVPSVAVELERHTHFHRVTPIVALDLKDDRLEVRAFAAAAGVAWKPFDAVDTALVFEYGADDTWRRRSGADRGVRYDAIEAEASDGDSATVDSIAHGGGATATDAGADVTPVAAEATSPIDVAEAWREVPHLNDVAPMLQWLQRLELRPPAEGAQARWLPAHGRVMARLGEAWEQVPQGVAFYGNEAARKLLDRRRRVVPRLKVTASGFDWLEVSASWQTEGVALSDDDIAVLRKATTTFVRLPSGWVRRESAGEHAAAADLLADLGIEPGEEPARLSVFALAGASADTLAALGGLDADQETMASVQRLRERIDDFAGIPRIELPDGFRGDLRPYQRDGLDFLAYAAGLEVGAMLADDMGLGKTVQALAWLQWLRQRDPDGGPALVVCPASVVHNWVAEAAQFAPELKVVELCSGKERSQQMENIEACDLAVTNYTLLRRDIGKWREKNLRALVLDEAQYIKNPDAEVSRAVRSLSARFRLALTGTPIENRALDLWSIVDCINPGYLGQRADFATRFDGLDVPPHRRKLLAAKLRPVLLRRTKGEVAPELPDRIEESRYCELTPGQRRLYLAELAKSRKLIAELDGDPEALRRNKISILAALTRLRQVCCHPALAGGKETLGSGKFDGLFEVLEPLLEEGHKVLLFSQFVECIKLLETQLRERKIATHVLTGQTKNRKDVVSQFNACGEPCVFLISLKAGGTGLNLTSANHVVLFDPWWNPAVEAQAIDRTHRIGQDRTVIACRLIAQGTIEEKIRELQRQKEGLVRDVLGEGGFARALTRADLDFLLDEG